MITQRMVLGLVGASHKFGSPETVFTIFPENPPLANLFWL